MPLPTIPLGRTALIVTRIGLGTAPIGNLYAPLPDSQAEDVVRAAFDAGVRLIDTAPLYGAGLAEKRVGAALAALPRDKIVLSTKVGRLVHPDGSVTFNYSRDDVLRSLEASLTRLGLDRVDILLVHDPDNHERQTLDETFPTLVELRAQGVIGAIGAGMNQWQMLERFARHADVDCFLLAGRYTLLEQTSLDFLELCRQRGIGIFLGGVFNSGILATGPVPGAKFQYADAPPAVLEKVRRLQEVCKRHGVPLATAALQFALAHPAVTSLLLGAVTPAEVQANIAASAAPVPSALWHELRALELLHPQAPLPA